jgi:8-oxo-dGTP pyrophosphatase MutT (NUDIX family)
MHNAFAERQSMLAQHIEEEITALAACYGAPRRINVTLTGGIDHGEAVEAALLREIAEETGLEVAVRRFLAVIEYTLAEADKAAGANPSFATFAFLVDEIGGTFGVVDEDEQIGAFREIDVEELPALADTLASVADGYHPEIDGSWADWGRFRAVVQRSVYDALVDAD